MVEVSFWGLRIRHPKGRAENVRTVFTRESCVQSHVLNGSTSSFLKGTVIELTQVLQSPFCGRVSKLGDDVLNTKGCMLKQQDEQ